MRHKQIRYMNTSCYYIGEMPSELITNDDNARRNNLYTKWNTKLIDELMFKLNVKPY